MQASPSPKGIVVSSRYRLRRKLGAGSLGTVFLAQDEGTGRLVALKVLHSERLDPGAIEQIQREFQSFAGLHHSQIAAAYDFGYTEEGRIPFYTREYVEGSPLAPGPPGPGAVSPREFLAPFFDLLDALHYLHAHEILHLDIHAGNLIVSGDQRRGSVLIDFGLGRLLRGRGSPALLLPPESLPPEVLTEEPLRPSTDIYSVGRLLLFRLTGREGGDPRLPREIPGWDQRISLEFERAIAKALQRDPGKRFQSAAEFREALSCALGGASTPRPGEPGELTVGREAEVATIEEALREGGRGGSAVVWFVGPHGIGKSRLLEECRLRAQLRGLDVVEARCLGGAAAQPVLLHALRSSGRGRKEPRWLAPLSVKHGGSSAERSRRAAGAFFEEDGPPLVIILDDLERADSESRLLADALLEECVSRRTKGISGRGLTLVVASVAAPDRSIRGVARFRHRLAPLGSKDAMVLLRKLLRPLVVSAASLARCSRAADGFPLRLRRIARALHAEFDRPGLVPDGAQVAPDFLESGDLGPFPVKGRGPAQRDVLRALAVLDPPANLDEVVAATRLSPRTAGKALRRLEEEEVVVRSTRGRRPRYAFAHPQTRAGLIREAPADAIRAIHERVAEFLGRQSDPGPSDARRARHLLGAGRRREGRRAALDGARLLARQGLLHAGIRLLTDALAGETDRGWRLRFIEEISSFHEQAGDHREGALLLEEVHRGSLGPLSRAAAIRIRRRLGVHCHRSGAIDRALELFREVRKLADPARHLEDLVIVESELAEMHTFRGEYREAEEACRRGLWLLARASRSSPEFRGRMEMMLRASRGHLELRRMATESAREELEGALKLARRFGTTTGQAFILNNLGIVHNQLNDFVRARRSYVVAERLLERSGERLGIIHTACNLATIAAKTGDAGDAREHIERASHLLARHPGKKLELVVEVARGMVSHSLGDMSAAAASFAAAMPLGRELGDTQITGFAGAYLSEALAACGRHGEALATLRALIQRLPGRETLALDRAVRSRLLALEELLGQDRSARKSREALRRTPGTGMAFLEAWNDVFIATARSVVQDTPAVEPSVAEPSVAEPSVAEPSEPLFRKSLEAFLKLGTPAGARCARIGLLFEAVRSGGAGPIRDAMRAVEDGRDSGAHKLLAVLEPLALAEAAFALGESERAEDFLGEAESAIVGHPFLELDWRIEHLAALLAQRKGDRDEARRCLQRAIHTRDLLSRSLPARLRSRFLGHHRFSGLCGLSARLERPPITPVAVPRADGEVLYQGMVGRSPALREVFRTIDRLRDQEIRVLITGETGTGKDLVARAIHRTGPRRRGPFLALHCASLPTELFEAELLGYEAGAFTGADEARPGLLEHLSGGTLLLDEVANLSPENQVKLLRLLDGGAIRRLGGVEERAVDVRVLAASTGDLEALAGQGRFRMDLFFRLRGIEIRLPPLRARREDIPLLAAHFLALHAKRFGRQPPVVKSDALRLLEAHDWPGNVRELETVVLRLLAVTSPGVAVGADALRLLLPPQSGRSIFGEDLFEGRKIEDLHRELDRAYLVRLFRREGGDLRKVMEKTGAPRSSLYRWLRKAGLDAEDLRRP